MKSSLYDGRRSSRLGRSTISFALPFVSVEDLRDNSVRFVDRVKGVTLHGWKCSCVVFGFAGKLML
jgi:hypothetical protein